MARKGIPVVTITAEIDLDNLDISDAINKSQAAGPSAVLSTIQSIIGSLSGSAGSHTSDGSQDANLMGNGLAGFASSSKIKVN